MMYRVCRTAIVFLFIDVVLYIGYIVITIHTTKDPLSRTNIIASDQNTDCILQATPSATSGRRFVSDVKRVSVMRPSTVTQLDTQTALECSIPIVGVVTGIILEPHKCILSTLEHMPVVFVIDSDNRYTNINKGKNTLYFMNLEDQARLYPVLDRIIPHNNYARKNLGYIYALRVLGACRIWDFDDDNCLTSESSGAVVDESSMKAVLTVSGNTNNDVNPYLLYGAPGGFIWPRGMPMEAQDKASFPRLTTKQYPDKYLDVVQFMQEVDPDVDAIWRLQNGKGSLPLKWDTHEILKSQTVALRAWAPFNAQSTLLSAHAAAIAYLPFTVHGRVSDIWRSYIMQYLMGQERVGFRGAFIEHHRNPHDYMADMQAETPLYEQAGALVAYLRNRTPCVLCSQCVTECDDCSKDTSICYMSLLDDLYTRGFIEAGDVNAGYVWTQATSASLESFDSRRWNYTQPVSSRLNGVIAVLHVNSGLRSTIPIWMAIHGHSFKEVMAYVPGSGGCIPISGITIQCISDDTRGYWAYESMVHAIQNRISLFVNTDSVMRSLDFASNIGGDPYSDNAAAALDATPPMDSGIDGFLFTHDDVIWSTDRIFTELNNSVIASNDPWSHSSTEWMWTVVDSGSRSMRRFNERYREINGRYGQSDFFFIPLREAPHFARVGVQMLHSGVFLEIAVPTIISDSAASVRYVSLYTTWDSNTRNDREYMANEAKKGSYDLYHPVKMSSLSGVLAHTFYL